MDQAKKDELAAARAKKVERERAKAEAAEARELEVLNLEEELEAKYGPRGQGFEIVDTVAGPIALRLGESILHQRFQSAKLDDASVDEYVRPCIVSPSLDKYTAIIGARPAIAYRCATALATLYGAKDADDTGKY
jgi:hypothetical protein